MTDWSKNEMKCDNYKLSIHVRTYCSPSGNTELMLVHSVTPPYILGYHHESYWMYLYRKQCMLWNDGEITHVKVAGFSHHRFWDAGVNQIALHWRKYCMVFIHMPQATWLESTPMSAEEECGYTIWGRWLIRIQASTYLLMNILTGDIYNNIETICILQSLTLKKTTKNK